MSGWLLALLTACACFGLLVGVARIARGLWPALGAVIACALAGYAWQGEPGMAGAPHEASTVASAYDEQMVLLRRSLAENYGAPAQWMTVSDGLARAGESQSAVNVIRAALASNPRSVDLWVGLGNALIMHGRGAPSPASDYAYRQALQLQSDDIGANFFFGVSQAREGKFEEARARWKPLLSKLSPKHPLYRVLVSNLAQIDMATGQQGANPAP